MSNPTISLNDTFGFSKIISLLIKVAISRKSSGKSDGNGFNKMLSLWSLKENLSSVSFVVWLLFLVCFLIILFGFTGLIFNSNFKSFSLNWLIFIELDLLFNALTSIFFPAFGLEFILLLLFPLIPGVCGPFFLFWLILLFAVLFFVLVLPLFILGKGPPFFPSEILWEKIGTFPNFI